MASFLLGSACATPRCLAHGMASSSQPAVAPAPWRSTGRRARRGPPPRRITNTQKEIWEADDDMRERARSADADTREFIFVNESPVWDAEKGPLEAGRVTRTQIAEQASDEISVLETAYWFHTPPDGWKTRVKVPVAPEVEGDFPHPEHPEEEKGDRFPLDGLEEGMVLEGLVTDIWLYHGAQVDFMGEFDGLIRITEEEWKQDAVRDSLLPGTPVRVRVHRLAQRDLYRWPVQLELLDDELAPLIADPDSWTSPADLAWAYDQGWDLDQVCAVLHRKYHRMNYMLEPDMAAVADQRNWQYGWDEPDINGTSDDWITRELDVATDIDISLAAGQALLGEL
ncbi:MAG: hypothetical protein J3K34DRAFT_435096 [Monoraphidium minutum]|nr:MAG: hypothetical protein J3K34DRAFT_435096 [Monoraphidium minutum]